MVFNFAKKNIILFPSLKNTFLAFCKKNGWYFYFLEKREKMFTPGKRKKFYFLD